MPKPQKLSPEQQATYTAEYLETLDRIDNLRVELKEEMKERKGEIAALEKAAFRLRRLLAGREDEQLEVPGSEIPSVRQRRGGTTSVTFEGGDFKALGDAADVLEQAGRKARKGARR